MFWGNVGGGLPGPRGNPADMSLRANVAGQNFTFLLINSTNDAPLTGATVVGFTSRDGGAQASIAGTVTQLGNGAYNYAVPIAETNGNCLSFLMTATTPAAAVPENLMFLTTGLHRSVGRQHVTFCLFTTAGAADTAATVSPFVSIDGGAQASGAGTVTNLGNGQYDYQPTSAETNGTTITYTFTAPGDVPVNICIFTVP